MRKIWLHGAQNSRGEVVDLYIAEGRLLSKEQAFDLGFWTQDKALAEDVSVIEANGKLLLPGLIDAHVHLRDPGQTQKEDIKSGTRAAARGGVTSVLCMPNTRPVIDDVTVLRYVMDKAKREALVNVFPIAAATKGQQGELLTDMGKLKEAGAVAVSDDGVPVATAAMMQRTMSYASDFDLPVIDHCEEMTLAEGGVMNEGETSAKLGVQGIPSIAEDIIVARDILLAEYLDCPVHLAHISTARSVQLIREAKARGVKVTAETCPHYWVLTDEACDAYNTLARVNPPLRQKEDQEAIVAGLQDGTLDLIVTDHAPHHVSDKEVPFEEAKNGMIGLETAWALVYTYLVKTGKLTLEQVEKAFCRRPAEIFHLQRGTLAEGEVADLILVDLEETWTIDRFKMASSSNNSPYHQCSVQSRVHLTMVAGDIVYLRSEDEAFLAGQAASLQGSQKAYRLEL